MNTIKKSIRKSGRPVKNLEGELSARERILETALKLFYGHGIHNVGIDRIIAESDVAKMTFFKHFPSKQDLVIAFLELRDIRYMNWVETTLDSITTNKSKRLEAMPKVIEAWFNLSDFRGCAFINTTVEYAGTSEINRELCYSHKLKLREFIETLAKDAGYKKCKRLSELFVLLIDGATITAQIEGPKAASELLKESSKILLSTFR